MNTQRVPLRMEAVLDRGSFCSVFSTAVLLGVFISHFKNGRHEDDIN